jgi:hypothetical protein
MRIEGVGSPRSKTSIGREVSSLQSRLENKGKRITRISLAECLDAAFRSEATAEEWFENERMFGAEKAIEDVHKLLADRVPLVNLVADGMPHAPDPRKDVVFIVRTGALFPVYWMFSLLEQLKGRVVEDQMRVGLPGLVGAPERDDVGHWVQHEPLPRSAISS